MLPIQPFLFNAYYSWIAQSGCTPYIYVNCMHPGVRVPLSVVSEDQTVILNIGMASANNLTFDDDTIVFNASFRGKQERIIVPIQAVMSIYAKENNKVGTLLNSPEASSGLPVDIVESSIVNEPQKQTESTQHKESVAERVERKLKLVNNDNTNKPKQITDRRGKLHLVH